MFRYFHKFSFWLSTVIEFVRMKIFTLILAQQKLINIVIITTVIISVIIIIIIIMMMMMMMIIIFHWLKNERSGKHFSLTHLGVWVLVSWG